MVSPKNFPASVDGLAASDNDRDCSARPISRSVSRNCPPACKSADGAVGGVFNKNHLLAAEGVGSAFDGVHFSVGQNVVLAGIRLVDGVAAKPSGRCPNLAVYPSWAGR